MAVRTVSAAAVLAAAVAVYALWCRRDRRLRREAVAERLVCGRVQQDNVVLREAVERLHAGLYPLLVEQAVVAAAVVVVAEALSASDPMSPPMEGGPK